MTCLEVLLEGASDVPALRVVLEKKFNLVENIDFRLHPHQGRGKLPANLLKAPDPKNRGLLDVLPAKLRGYAKSLPSHAIVLVVIDADNDPCYILLKQLKDMLSAMPSKPNVLFRLAIEETESWFIADLSAIKKAFPRAKLAGLKNIQPDAIVGAWERLAEAVDPRLKNVSGAHKFNWATKIAPHLDLDNPKSPSFKKLIEGIDRKLKEVPI